MRFTTNAFCTVWSVEPISEARTKARISISKKNKQTGEYEDDVSGFVIFAGTAAASKALKLKEKERIRLKEGDYSEKYDKEKNTKYHNLTFFSFDTQDEIESKTESSEEPTQNKQVDDGDVDDSRLPF